MEYEWVRGREDGESFTSVGARSVTFEGLDNVRWRAMERKLSGRRAWRKEIVLAFSP